MKNFLYHLHIFFSRVAKFFSSEKHLHNARFARPHELVRLSSPKPYNSDLLLGLGRFNQVLHVQSIKERWELGNVFAVGPSRSGKTLLAESQLLTWKYSAIVNDIKGELFTKTAGYRETLGRVLVIDPRGVGNQYDPLEGRETEDELYNSAKHLMYDPNDREPIFTQRATKMLTLLFLAARKKGCRLLPFVGQMADLGLNSAASKINAISPLIARRLLEGEYNPNIDYEERKFLSSAWESLTARLFPLLTEKIVRCFDGSDFTGRDVITSEEPITVYLRWPESDLLAKAPLVRLIWESLMKEMIDTYDSTGGIGCHLVLGLLDELCRTSIQNISEHATTVNGRGISLFIAIQSLSQLDAVYGVHRAKIIRDNMDSQIFYRPCNQETADYLQKCLGYKSGFAHSENSHNGVEASKGLSEREIPLMTAQEIMQMSDEEIIGFHRGLPPFQGKRMDWRRFPVLVQRKHIPPPQLSALPPLEEKPPDRAGQSPEQVSSWHLAPDLIRRREQPAAANGLRKSSSKDTEAGFRPQTH